MTQLYNRPGGGPIFPISPRIAKFKRPHILGDQKISEDNQELRPGCSRHFVKELTQKFSSQQIFQVIFLLPTKNSSMRTSTTFMIR